MEIQSNVKAVRVYTYRTADVRNVFITLPRDLMRSFELELCTQLKISPDNHTAYQFEDSRGRVLYCRFDDFTVRIGTEIAASNF